MKTRLLFTIVLCIISANSFGQNTKKIYRIATIADTLKKNVNVVVREDHIQFRILDKSNAIMKTHFVATIFNEKGNRFAKRSTGYNKLTKIKDINAYAYDAEGKLLKRLKNSEIYDHAAFDGVSLYNDQRVKSINLAQVAYPYTVEFDEEIEFNYLYSIPGSVFIPNEKISAEHVSYQIEFPTELAPRYKVLNISDNVVKGLTGDGFNFLRWDYRNLYPITFEPLGPGPEEICPQIIFAPSKFEYAGYAGDMSSWKEYGKWNALLNKGRDELPAEEKQKVKTLVQGARSTQEKTKILYEYLQSKSRYVGIQLGIGGLQPFPASDVVATGYGDCKALSNYMVALLKEAQVKAFYTTIQAGDYEPEVVLDFPSHQANHVIVAVPNGKDTLWLECTSQTKPFGFMGRFTEDRSALMITEEGGKIVRTPSYKPEQNLQTRTATVTVDEKGNAVASVRTRYTGIQYENGGLSEVANQHADEQKKWINEYIDIPVFKLNSFSLQAKRDIIPSATLSCELTLDRYASVSGKRIFVTPNIMNRTTYIPEKVNDRKTEVVRRNNYIDYDTVRIKLPETTYPEFVPKPVSIKSRFAEYNASFEFKNGEVIYIRSIKSWKGRYPKESYQELVDFYKNVSKADNIKLVFLSKT